MATARPFTYNTGAPITGTVQVGDLAVGYPVTGFTGMEWWNGPDEELGYVIAQPVSGDTQPTPVPDDALFLSPTYKGVDIALSNNNQTASQIFSYSQTVLGETIISGSNKVMFSVLYTSTNPTVGVGGHFVGVGLTTMNYSGPFDGYPGNDIYSIGFSDDGKYYFDGDLDTAGLPTWTNGDIIDIAIASGQYWWIRVNGGNWNNNPLANPTTLANGLVLNGIVNAYPALCPYIYGTMEVLNYPAYAVPSTYNFLGNVTASVGFFRTDGFDDNEFVDIANILLNENYNNPVEASSALTSNGYWNSYISPVLSLDAGNPLSYPGTGTTWTDLVGGKTFNLVNGPTYDPLNGGKIYFSAPAGQYAQCNTSLQSLPEFTISVWHNWDGVNTAEFPCIITEVFVGGAINYVLGKPQGAVAQGGYFNGGFQLSPQFGLTANTWYNIVTTCDSNQVVKVYVNNVLLSTTSTTGGQPSSSNAGIRLMRRWDFLENWGGYLSIVNIYDKSLDQSQITSYWNSTKSRFGL
jgi:hypothetical protein